MALQRALTPALVVCSGCRETDDVTDHLVSLADPVNGSVCIRDMCAAIDCVELQVRSHLCADHAMEFELAWLHQIPVRACHGCRQSVIVLYREERDVWFVLNRPSDPSGLRGVELRVLDKTRLHNSAALIEAAFQSPVRAAKGKARAKLSSGNKRMRRSARTLQQLCDKERLRALEWSLGNVDTKYLFLWQDNKRRLEAEKAVEHGHGTDEEVHKVPKSLPPRSIDHCIHPEPLEVFCIVDKCRFYAKSGERCRFHSQHPLPSPPMPK